MESLSPEMRTILDLARWAPSGDNEQNWVFEPLSPRRLRVRFWDTRNECIYDRDGHASQISMGTLLETLAIAASGAGLTCDVERLPAEMETGLISFDITFTPCVGMGADPLLQYVKSRTVQRCPLSTRRLDAHQVQALRHSVGPEFDLMVFPALRQRFRFARMLYRSAKLRLISRDAYEVHRRIIKWGTCFSPTGVPDQALGASKLTLATMRPAMESFDRVQFINRYMAGTVMPRIELDFIPALACYGQFVLTAHQAPRDLDDYVAAGRAIQRFWLTVTKLGLLLQPTYTPLVFSRFARVDMPKEAKNRRLLPVEAELRIADQTRKDLDNLLGTEIAARAVFMGRIGFGPAPRSRSTRLPLENLLGTKPRSSH